MINIITKLLNDKNIEWKPLGKLLIRTKGTKITASQMKELHKNDAPLKIFAGGKTFALVNFDDIPKKDINREPSIIVKSRGIIEFEYYDKPFSHKNEMWSYHSKDKNINIKYIYYILKNQEKYFQNLGSKMQMPQIATPDTDKFEIPIPSIFVQTEIVRILDTFTALTAELTAELTTRKKQYNYYRDKLLTFKDDEVEWKALENITLPTSNIKWKETDRAYKYIDLTSVSRETKSIIETTEITAINAPSRAQKIVEENDVIFATTRPTLQRFTLIEKEFSENIASTGYCVLRANRNYILPKWIYYNISSTRFNNYVNENQSGTAYPSISDVKVKQFKIPIPPLKEQARIVEILDKFDALTNSITEGLPREIELRQKQYEYYRNLLLDFPKVQE
ncbi:MAG: restriction endonuclease subunit S [Gilliamella sp.]|nr:restriction endonuclease subunit S [Gilliamella sp.]